MTATSSIASAEALDGAPAGAQALIDSGLKYLKTQQKSDGGWHAEQEPPAITALVLRAFVGDENFKPTDDFIKKGYERLLTYQQDNGGIYNNMLANYNTAISVSALAAADQPEHAASLERAVAFLKNLQWTDRIEGVKVERDVVPDDTDPRFGGWGYGRHARPDGSNAQMAIDALHAVGLKPADPAFKNALKFITRQQNLSETNDQPWSGNDGGFVYTPAGGKPGASGESFAGEYTGPDGRRILRSYGSMTYAGLKSMIYAGLTKDDPRVKAAWDWVTKNWTLDENPGMKLADPAQAQNGLYYYYMTLARALDAYDQPIITDPDGKQHDWRIELIDKLASIQNPDGAWAGDKRWMEDNPVIVTS
ncbi:MAG: prenyltransferase/squalene oxidase repeat-containing protein, partial [Tepidisphaeraceae bacterium]